MRRFVAGTLECGDSSPLSLMREDAIEEPVEAAFAEGAKESDDKSSHSKGPGQVGRVLPGGVGQSAWTGQKKGKR